MGWQADPLCVGFCYLEVSPASLTHSLHAMQKYLLFKHFLNLTEIADKIWDILWLVKNIWNHNQENVKFWKNESKQRNWSKHLVQQNVEKTVLLQKKDYEVYQSVSVQYYIANNTTSTEMKHCHTTENLVHEIIQLFIHVL